MFHYSFKIYPQFYLYCYQFHFILGFGKLKMRDGSYYEGEFLNGEIHGTGTRLWSHTNNIYQGQFDLGEMNGMGVMTYGKSGDVYEGHWVDNKAEGLSVLYGICFFIFLHLCRLLFVVCVTEKHYVSIFFTH